MLTCVARSKQPNEDHHHSSVDNNKQPIKSLTSQIKDMALKASGAYKQCSPCTSQPTTQNKKKNGGGGGGYSESDSVGSSSSSSASEKFRWANYKRTGSYNSSSSTAGRRELEARLKGISSGEVTPSSISASASGRRLDPVVFVEENEPKEWVAQVDPGVLITFLSLPRGGNDLKRIRFSREKFNKWQAQRWWAENYERVMELYNVQRLNRQAIPPIGLPTTPPSATSELDDQSWKQMEMSSSVLNSPITPPLSKERLPHTLFRPMGYSSGSESMDAAKMSSISSSVISTTTTVAAHHAKNEEASASLSAASSSTLDASMDTASSSKGDAADRYGDNHISTSNASELEMSEWVEQDEPGVYITIRALPNGRRELKRVRFSREKFGEMHARLWWAENRARIHKQYLL